jgi:hypothetical protein
VVQPTDCLAGLPVSEYSCIFGRGKPKKGGRPGGRDGKRIRPSNDPDMDDEDDY